MTHPPAETGSTGSGPYARDFGSSPKPVDVGPEATTQDDFLFDPDLGETRTAEGDSTPSTPDEADDTQNTATQVAGTAKGQAKQVAGTAVESGKKVADTAKDEAGNVAAEAKQQAASLLDTVRTELGESAGTQQNRIADALHGLSKELGGMASSSDESGPLTDLAHEASRRGGEIAHWLQDKEPADVLESVRSYARRRPGTFLILCGVAGVIAGRLTRSAVATTSLDNKNNDETGTPQDRGSSYAAQPAFTADVPSPYGSGSVEPAPYANQPVDTASYGSVPADRAPYGSKPPMPNSGFAGTTDPLADPNAGATR